MQRIKLEIKRQPFHILIGLFFITLIYYDLLNPLNLLTIIIIAIIASLYVKKTKPKTIHRLLKFLEREEDLKELPGKGLIAYLIGTLLVLTLFEKDIALASIMILALGDSFSRLIGPFGKIRHPFNNTEFLEGVIAGIIAASLGAMLFIKPSEAIISSFFAMLIEGFDIKLFGYKIDDNLTIPLIAGVVVWLMRVL